VFNINCRPATRRLATIHERDQPTNVITTRSIARTSPYVSEALKRLKVHEAKFYGPGLGLGLEGPGLGLESCIVNFLASTSNSCEIIK